MGKSKGNALCKGRTQRPASKYKAAPKVKRNQNRKPKRRDPNTDPRETAISRLREISRRCRNVATTGQGPAYTTVMDNGAVQCLVGNKDWKVIKRHKNYVTVEGAIPGSSKLLEVIDAEATALDSEGTPIAILQINQGIHCKDSDQSLIAEDQLEWFGTEVQSRAKHFGGQQCIKATTVGKKPCKSDEN